LGAFDGEADDDDNVELEKKQCTVNGPYWLSKTFATIRHSP
jgi:hypothetical protein